MQVVTMTPYQTNQLLYTLQLEMAVTRRVLLEGKLERSLNLLVDISLDLRFILFNVCYGLSICIRFRDPQPEYSAFREASYGHSTLEIRNRTHALYHWNRNDDGKKVATDAFVLRNQYWLVYFCVMMIPLFFFSSFLNENSSKETD